MPRVLPGVLGLLSLGFACGVAPTSDDEGTDVVDHEGPPGCLDNDDSEPNELPETATALAWGSVDGFGGHLSLDAFLCPGESDWYFVPVSQLEYEFYGLHVDGIAAGSSWCANVLVCGEPTLPEAAEHVMRIEVFDAKSLLLVAEGVGLN
ncbi:hypothetical protein, partial [Enhygromyxa salina]|uniref:hypothetical protein n=1 Tax=Enhygromyxa salina TaxID=215803 RepID=UPI0011B23534